MNEQYTKMALPEAEAAVDEPDDTKRAEILAALAAALYTLAWDDNGGEGDAPTIPFVKLFDDVIKATTVDSDPAVIAGLFATAAENAAIVDIAGVNKTQLTWRTMMDDRVRDSHRPMEGVTQAAGRPFNVGGFPLLYPGQPVGPPELWMNCRCSLDVATTAGAPPPADPAVVARTEVPVTNMTNTVVTAAPPQFTKGKAPPFTRKDSAESDDCPEGQHLDPDTGECVDDDEEMTAASDTPWSQFSASDYTIEQWRRACLLKMPGGDPESKSTYKLPVREPGGALNRNGVHAAAAALGGARGGVSAPPAAVAAAKAKLRGLYKQLGEDPPDSLAADASLTAWAPSTSPPGTHDAPGWITNPRDTQRLRDYWAKGTGAAKIRWGMPGDFDRCRKQLAKYVQNPQWLAGTCANLHFVALGYWPGQGPHASGAPQPDPDEITAAVTEAFEQADKETPMGLPPRQWFDNPNLTGPTPLHLEGDGRLVGHLATWGTCHVGIENACTEAPRSLQNYAYFRTGEVETDGGMVAVGQITMDTGHADRHLGPNETVSHYDNTGTVVADVAAGEDAHGIWLAGAMRPGLTMEQMRALRAGAPSGDWRRIGGNLELVAALMVNVPGFPVPRVELAAAGELLMSLTAAGVVVVDPNAVVADSVAELVVAKMEAKEAAKHRASRARSLNREVMKVRVAELVASVEG